MELAEVFRAGATRRGSPVKELRAKGKETTSKYGAKRRRVDFSGGRFKRAIRVLPDEGRVATPVVAAAVTTSFSELFGHAREAQKKKRGGLGRDLSLCALVKGVQLDNLMPIKLGNRFHLPDGDRLTMLSPMGVLRVLEISRTPFEKQDPDHIKGKAKEEVSTVDLPSLFGRYGPQPPEVERITEWRRATILVITGDGK